ncbi:GntR family transcriptional regulator [Cohaesibacter gelatinilyticus]|uniref:Transcriptional regulator, GntR family n=1 Tax=Cohaesibacter gelatinilyticus TaxID=372072 RepID=A0A285PFG3_9HYPH|nr:GntR family transcriptional regulator [Cohaesibacter gelatinilyticus]SNZ20462.1 transcriptional regulator, GntR family [Cohaesibacter gelatinilyticus]
MKLTPVDISKTASASEIVFDALKKAIIEGELEIGTQLKQDEIARLFNTSRIPVREAISRLEQQGLVKSQRYKGAVVSGLSVEEAEEIFQFRMLLEPEVMRHAVPKMSASVLKQAQFYYEEFSKSKDPMEWGDLNRKFHSTLYDACALQYHLGAIDHAMDQIDRYLRAQLVLSDGIERANIEHNAILQACKDRDADLAAKLTYEHINGAKDSLLVHIAKA